MNLSFSDFVAAELARDAEAEVRRYLVVDTAVTRPRIFPDELGIGSMGIDVLSGEACEWRTCAGPAMIELSSRAVPEAGRRRLVETLQKWRLANCFLYVESTAPADEYAKVLLDRTDAVLGGGLSVLLRFYDPRVFAAILKHFDEGQLATMLGAGLRWAYCGRRGELHVVPTALGLTSLAKLPFVLNSEQEAALIRAGEVDAMVDLLLNQSNAQLMTRLPPDQHEVIAAALASAMDHHIERHEDLVAFCSLSLALGVDFPSTPAWAESMSLVRNGRLGFMDAVARTSESEAA